MTRVEPAAFGYRAVYAMVVGIDVEGNPREQTKLFNLLRLYGKIAEQHVCLGRVSAFELLISEDDVEKSINLLQNRLGQPFTILGIRGQPATMFPKSKQITLTETDYKMIQLLVNNPRRDRGYSQMGWRYNQNDQTQVRQTG